MAKMQQRRAGLIAGFVLFLACSLLPAPSDAAPDLAWRDLSNRIASLAEGLKTDRSTGAEKLFGALVGEGLLPAPRRFDQEDSLDTDRWAGLPKARAEVSNFRLVLAILSQSYGNKDNLDVTMAQGDRGFDTLLFREGEVTLDDIRAAMRSSGQDPEFSQGAPVLRRPVVLWEDTILRLTPADNLRFSRPDGAFIISLGRVEIEGSDLSVTGGENPHAPEFVPFLTVAGGGSLKMVGARVNGLGFGKTPKFSGVSVAGHTLMPPLGNTVIADTEFNDVFTLSIAGRNDARITGNTFEDMRHNALGLAGAPGTEISGNLFFGSAPTNAIRVLDNSDDTKVFGNILLSGERAGILVQGRSDRVAVTDNVVWRRGGSAIKFLKTECSLAAGNLVLDTSQKGIEVRKSNGSTVRNNTIVGSLSAGVWISAQPAGAVTHVTDNSFFGNSAGVSTAVGAQVVLAGNDLRKQFPRLLDGDIALQTRAILTDLTGQQPVTITASGTGPATAPLDLCNERRRP